MEITESFLLESLEALKREILENLHTAMPGTILSYDSANGIARVQPGLRRQASGGKVLTAPELSGVPVFLSQPGQQVSPGDPCILLFMDFCMDGWLETGQPVIPPSPRMHDLSDAFALAGKWKNWREIT